MSEREKPLSQAAVAKLYDVDARTIRNWVTDGMPERRVNGSPMYMLSEVIPWRRERDKADARANAAPDLGEEQARKMRADADLSELKVQQLRGEWVAAADVEQRIERLCQYLRARVLSVRSRWAPKVLGLATMPEATAAMDALTADVLAALSEQADELDEGEAA